MLDKTAFDALLAKLDNAKLSAQGADKAMEEFLVTCTDKGFVNFAKNIQNGADQYEDYKASVIAANAQQKALNAEMIKTTAIAAARNIAITMGISLLITGAVKLIQYFVDYNKNVQEAADTAHQKVSDLASEVDSLKETIANNNDEIFKLTDPQDIENLKKENQKLKDQLTIKQQLLKIAQDEDDKAAKKAVNSFMTDSINKTVVDDTEGGTQYNVKVGYTDAIRENIQAYKDSQNEIEALEKKQSSLGDITSDNVGEYNSLQAEIDKLKTKSTDYQTTAVKLNESFKTAAGDSSLYADEVTKLDSEIAGICGTSNTASDATENLANEISDAAKSADEISAAWDKINSSIDSVQSSYSSLSTAVQEYNANGTLSLDTLQSLLTLDSAYLATLDMKNGKLSINGQLLQAQAEAQLNAAKAHAIDQANTELLAISQENAAGATTAAGYATAAQMQQLAAIVPALDGAAASVVNFALAEQFLSNYQAASANNSEKAKNVVDGLNTKLKLIDSTMTTVKSGTIGFTNALGGFKSATDAVTDSLTKEKEALEATKTALEDKKSIYDSALKAINKLLDDEIEKLNKEKDALSDPDIIGSYGQRIQAIQDEIDALNDANDAKEKQIALEKAQAELERAQHQKSIRIYRNGVGFVWEADQSAIAEAKANLEKAKLDKQVSDLEDAKKKLEAALAVEEKAIDKNIKKLQGYKEAWADVSSAYEDEQDRLHAAQLLGQNWEKDILKGRTENLTNFKTTYFGIMSQIASKAEEIEALEKRISEAAKAAADASAKLNGLSGSGSTSTDKVEHGCDVVGPYGTLSQHRTVAEADAAREAFFNTAGIGVNDPRRANYYLKQYANGTLSASGGLANVDDGYGKELVIRPRKGRYSVLEQGTGVIPAKQTKTLWDFADNPAEFMQKQLSSMLKLNVPASMNLQAPQTKEIKVEIGDIVMHGVNDEESFASVLRSHIKPIIAQSF